MGGQPDENSGKGGPSFIGCPHGCAGCVKLRLQPCQLIAQARQPGLTFPDRLGMIRKPRLQIVHLLGQRGAMRLQPGTRLGEVGPLLLEGLQSLLGRAQGGLFAGRGKSRRGHQMQNEETGEGPHATVPR